MEDVLVRELPPKSSVDINDYVVMEDYDGTKIAKLEDIKSTIASHLYFNSLDDVLESSLNEGDVCIALGRYEVNDGGFGIYKIVNNPALIEDKVLTFYLNTSDTLRAVLIHDGTINVHQAGAYGDGVHDDTYAIQRALNTKLNVNFCNNKEYLCSTSIKITNWEDFNLKNNAFDCYNQIIDFNGSSLLITSNGNGIEIEYNSNYGTNLKQGSIIIKNIGDIAFTNVNTSTCISINNSENITIENANLNISNPSNKAETVTGRRGLYISNICKNVYINGLNVTRIINDETERYSYNEYTSYIYSMANGGTKIFDLLEGNLPDYNNGNVLKRQIGTGIELFSINGSNNLVFNNINLNRLSKGISIRTAINTNKKANIKFSNVYINGIESSQFQGRMIESIENSEDAEYPYTITYRTLSESEKAITNKRKNMKVFISKYYNSNTPDICAGFYLNNSENIILDIDGLSVNNVADCFYSEISNGKSANIININNFNYFSDTLKTIGGGYANSDYVYNEFGARDSFSVIYNVYCSSMNNANRKGNIINLYGNHSYGGNSSLATSYIFGKDSIVNNYALINLYGTNCKNSIFNDDELYGVTRKLPIINEQYSLSKECLKVSNTDDGYKYANGGFIDLTLLNPFGDGNVYFTSNVNKPIRFIGTEASPILTSSSPLISSENSCTKDTSFSVSGTSGKIRLEYSISSITDTSLNININPILSNISSTSPNSINFGVKVDNGDYTEYTGAINNNISANVQLTGASKHTITCRLYINSTTLYQFSFDINVPFVKMDGMILNSYDRQVVRLTAPSNMIIESYDMDPNASSSDKCVFKYQGNIKLKDSGKKALDPIIPITLQYNKSSGLWFEI